MHTKFKFVLITYFFRELNSVKYVLKII